MSDKRSLFLIGPMGAGKTAVGKCLARMLDYPFIDSDQQIEERTGADISLIFEREGESGFRRREHEVLAALTQREPIVLATGGGAVLREDNRSLLSQRGWVVYLETTVAQQAERVGRARHRPLLQGVEPQARLTELMRVREPLYRGLADFTIPTSHRRVHAIAERIVQAYREQPRLSRGPQAKAVPAGR